MKRLYSRRLKLSSRDHAVILHVDRMRITTIKMLMCSVLKGLSRSAISKIVNRLCSDGYLKSYSLHHPARYFMMGEAGAGLLGRKSHRTMPLGPQSLPMEYATAAYCLLGNGKRKRLTPKEVRRHFPWLPERMLNSPMCLELSQNTLELIRVDLGGPPDHIARKCHGDIRERAELSQFNSLMKSGCVRLVVITVTAEKAAAIRATLSRHEWPAGLQFHCSIVPDLLTLLARKNHA